VPKCIDKIGPFKILEGGPKNHEYYIVYNTKMKWLTEEEAKRLGKKPGHAHIMFLRGKRARNLAYIIVENSLKKHFPKSRDINTLISHVRVNEPGKYRDKLEKLIKTKLDKKKGNRGYINPRKGVR
jgi:hypothetical protein